MAQFKRFLESLKRWFSYYKVSKVIYDFDYSSVLIVERHQLNRVRNTIIKYHNYIGWEHDVYWINIAIKLLDILIDDGSVKLIETPNKWFLPVYVNTRNVGRFCKYYKKEHYENTEIKPILLDYLRLDKAWNLYHTIRINYLRKWWV